MFWAIKPASDAIKSLWTVHNAYSADYNALLS